MDDLWEEWNNTKDPFTLGKILDELKPVRESYLNTFWGSTTIPKPVLENELLKLNINAVKSYNPSKKANLKTWANQHQQKLYRTIANYSNIGRLPERKFRMVGEFQRAVEHLTDKYDRIPSVDELADYLSWPQSQIEDMKRSIMGNILESQVDIPFSTPKTDNTKYYLEMIEDTLRSPEEKDVFNAVYGRKGFPGNLKTDKEIGKAIGIPGRRVTTVRNNIASRIKRLD